MNLKKILYAVAFLTSGIALTQPVNDDPCGAQPVNVGNTCNYIQYDNSGATSSAGIANPTCGNYGGQDVWFVAIVPPSGTINVDAQAGSLTNFNIAAYTATTCAGPFTEIACDLNSSTNGAGLPALDLSGLTPGTYVFFRVWDNYILPIPGPSDPLAQGTFELCFFQELQGQPAAVGCNPNNPAPTDDCAGALAGNAQLCSFDGYCGATTGYNENEWPALTSAFCGSIENNSFTTFEASSTSVSLTVEVTDPNGDCGTGIQFFMFSATTCGGSVVDIECESPMNVGTNTFTANGLTPGTTYFLMVDGWAGDECEYTINAGSGVNAGISLGADRTLCVGSSALLIATGADGNTVNWTGQNLNQSTGDSVIFTATSTGTYTIIADAPNITSSCGTSDTVVINVVSGSSINVTQTPCDANGNVTLTASGGTAYMWEPIDLVSQTSGGSVTVTPTVAGTYYIYGQNGGQCMDTTTVVVQPCDTCSPPPINITPIASVCEPNTVDIANAVGNPNGATLSYHSSAADAQNDVNPLPSTVVSASGTYYVRAEDPSDPTCVTVEQITVTINPLPTVDAGQDFTACPDEDIVLTADNPDGASISWDNGVQDGVNFNQPNPGTVTYTVTATLNGCTSTDQVDITVNPSPTLTIPGGSTQTICEGDQATFTVQLNNSNGAVTYEWTDDQGAVLGTSASETFSPTVTSWFYIEASDECYTLLDSVKINIAVVNVTAINIGDVTSCVGTNDDGTMDVVMNPPGGNYDFTISGGVQGQNFNNTTGDFTGLFNGTYQVTIIDNVTGCTLDTTAFVGSQTGTPPSITGFNVTDVSCGGAMDGAIELLGINGTSGNLPFDITWTPLSGAPIVEIGVITTIPTATHSQTGLYGSTWSIDIVDQIGCAFNITVDLFEPPTLLLGLTSNEPLCYGQSNGSIYINSTGGTTPYTYSIFDADSNQLTQGGSNAAELIPTGWYYTSVTDDNGCITADSIFLNQPDSLHATIITSNPLCAGDNSGWAQVNNVFNNQGNVTYNWAPNPSESETDSSWILPAGSYTITIVDSVGCIWQGAFSLTDPPALVLGNLTSSPSRCRGTVGLPGSGTVSGTASGGTGTPNYQWYTENQGIGAVTATWGNREPGWYTLCAQDANGCYVCDSVYVDSLNPEANFTVNPTSGTEPVTVTITDQSTERTTNTWSFFSTGGSSSNSFTIGYDSLQAPFDTTFNEGDYTICLIVANDLGCLDTLCQDVEIFPLPSITDPNVFTPNGDGTNDLWSPITEGISELNCTILNRWGHKVAELNSPTEKWDGTNKDTGKMVSDGVYSFVYTAKALNGTEFEGQGFIHLISK